LPAVFLPQLFKKSVLTCSPYHFFLFWGIKNGVERIFMPLRIKQTVKIAIFITKRN
jgi:hypothetical protein